MIETQEQKSDKIVKNRIALPHTPSQTSPVCSVYTHHVSLSLSLLASPVTCISTPFQHFSLFLPPQLHPLSHGHVCVCLCVCMTHIATLTHTHTHASKHSRINPIHPNSAPHHAASNYTSHMGINQSYAHLLYWGGLQTISQRNLTLAPPWGQ